MFPRLEHHMSKVKPAQLRHYEDKFQNPISSLVVAILTLLAFAISCVLTISDILHPIPLHKRNIGINKICISSLHSHTLEGKNDIYHHVITRRISSKNGDMYCSARKRSYYQLFRSWKGPHFAYFIPQSQYTTLCPFGYKGFCCHRLLFCEISPNINLLCRLLV